jgi:hypothetical protein
MRVTIVKDVDPATLAAQLTTALGKNVAVSTRNPGEVDNDGKPLPGVVVLLDAGTGTELADQDPQTVANVLAAHVVPPPPKSPAKALAEALATAGNIADLRSGLVAYVKTITDQEDLARARRRKPPKAG